MSKVAIKGNASGTGTFTLEAPNSNTDRTLTLPDEAGTVLTSGRSGQVMQIQHVQYATPALVNADVDSMEVITIDAMEVSITPTSASSKIMIQAGICGEWSNGSLPKNSMFFFMRDSTRLSATDYGSRGGGVFPPSITENTDAGSTMESVFYTYFDSPSTTDAIVYKPAFLQSTGGNNYDFYINRTVSDTDTTEFERGISFISVTEIAG